MVSLAKWIDKRRLLIYLRFFDKKIIQLLLGHLNIAASQTNASQQHVFGLLNWIHSLPFRNNGVKETLDAGQPIMKSLLERQVRIIGLFHQIQNVQKGKFLKIIGEIKGASANEFTKVIDRDEKQEVYIVANLLDTLNNEIKKWEEVDALVIGFLSNPHENAPREPFSKTLQRYRDESKIGLSELNKAIKLLRRGERVLERQFEKYK